jgi:nucleoside-diphosphate-sugar epimerase
MISYSASKVEAERALWKYYEETKPHYKLTTVLPSFVIGPVLPPPRSYSDLTESTTKVAIDFYLGKNRDPTLTLASTNYVSVLDVAKAHVKAVEGGEKTNGERYLLCAREFSFQEVVDIFLRLYPDRRDIIVEGQPGVYPDTVKAVDGSKAIRDLGIVYEDLESILVKTIQSVKNVI